MDKMTEASETLIFWLTTVAMPVFFLVLGGVIWLVRRGS
jgi:cytochrome c-type biogenesis protein CcmH/NrfF